MKKLMLKAWAKTLALMLLILLAVIVAASGLAIYTLIDSNAYASDWHESRQTAISGSFFWQQMGEVEYHSKIFLDNDRDRNAIDDFLWRFSEENSNFFFVVKDQSGKEILRNYDGGEYQYSETAYRDILFNERRETRDLSFRTARERQEYIQQSERNFAAVLYDVWDIDIDDDGKLDYVLKISYTVWDKQTIAITGFVKSQLTAQDSFLDAANWISRLFSLRYWLIVVCAVSIFLGLWVLMLLLYGAGRREEDDKIHLNWFHKIPFELCAPLPVFYAWFSIQDFFTQVYGSTKISAYVIHGVLPVAVWLPLVLFLLITLAVRVKTGSLWKSTLVYLVGDPVIYMVRSLPLFWKEGLIFLGIAFVEYVSYAFFSGKENVLLALWIAEKLLIFAAVALFVIDMRKLQHGAGEIAGGNFSYTINLRRMLPIFKHHGENLNSINARMHQTIEELTRSERLKTELITNVSHDIKTPITSIVNYVDLLKKDNLTTQEMKQYIAVLDRQAGRLKKMTDDLIQAAKASTGNVQVKLEQMDLNLLLSQALGEYRDRLARRRLETVVSFSEQAPLILADGQLLWRVFDNLLSNICKYALEGTRIYFSTQLRDKYACVTLKNISNHPLNITGDELLERFVQGDRSRASEGSGLGLSIAKGLTQLQSGEFEMTIDGDLFKTVLTFERYG
ncbi:MAG: HAMP domain-containing histidine kinase [Oscillospiraceae bacterium]|nr:HAMP domain-containing histidine kinase [Oscillospiraceae bacterium]